MTCLAKERNEALAAQGGRCFYCGRPITRQTATADHYVARSDGGEGRQTNIVAACYPCNQEKGDRDPNEFLASKRPGKSVARRNRRIDPHTIANQQRKAAERRHLGRP